MIRQKLQPIRSRTAEDVTLDSPRTPDEVRNDESDAALIAAVEGDEDIYPVMDLGGTKAYVSLMTGDASILYSKRHMTTSHDVKSGLFDFIRQCVLTPIDRVCALTGMKPRDVERRLAAIGIAFPGPTDPIRGLVLDASNFNAKDFPLAQKIHEYFDVPTFIDNDVNLAALGEAWKGAARGFDNVVGVMIGIGIGGGIIIDGQVYRGRNSTACEIGHMILDFDSNVRCGCEQYGCFEALASRKAMARDISARKLEQGITDMIWDKSNLLSNEIAEHYSDGDPDTVAIVTRAAEVCGKAVFTIMNLLNPAIVVFNGGFVYQLGDRCLDPVLEEVKKCMNSVYSGEIPIVIGELPNPVLYGACRMVMQRLGREVVHSHREILELLGRNLTEHDFMIPDELARNQAAPINKHPGDYHRDHLRELRNRGLVSTDEVSFRTSRKVQITELGRMLIESKLPAA